MRDNEFDFLSKIWFKFEDAHPVVKMLILLSICGILFGIFIIDVLYLYDAEDYRLREPI